MKLISVVTPCFNEAENIDQLVQRMRDVFAAMPGYRYEHIFIDNASTDDTVARIKVHASSDRNIRLIVNNRNFGHIRSPIHAMLAARGDAVIGMASDLQDPPELIPEFLKQWEDGFQMVVGVKPQSHETWAIRLIRKLYYGTIGRISDIRLIPNFTGFGLYDRSVLESIRKIDDPYPYFRGLVAELGFTYTTLPFVQPRRARGVSKNNFYTLYDLAMLGITSHSKVPIRLATMGGFALSIASLVIALAYLVAKLVMWNSFSLGTAPVLIGMFFLASVQLFFIGVLGEYVAAIHTQTMKRPLVTEKERINFDADCSSDSLQQKEKS